MTSEDPFQLAGTVVDGKYRVDGVLGEGGFSVVYYGVQLAFDRDIALKCLRLPTEFNSEARTAFFSRLREEGKVISRLSSHPSVVQVFDFGVLRLGGGDPVPYLVLERLHGLPLQELLRLLPRPLSEQEAAAMLRPVIDALAHGHRLGIAHRDLKPPNLFCAVGPSGASVKVLDFGIAKAIDEGCAISHQGTGTTKGVHAFSPQYAAPEQFRPAIFGSTGPWTDVHALGLLMVELVAGRPALAGGTVFDFYEACLTEKRPTPRALGITVSDQFESICDQALRLAPNDRFADASALLRALDTIVEEQRDLPGVVVEAISEATVKPDVVDRSSPSTDLWVPANVVVTDRWVPPSDPEIVFTPREAARTQLSSAADSGPFGPSEILDSGELRPTADYVDTSSFQNGTTATATAARRQRSMIGPLLLGAALLGLAGAGVFAAWKRPWIKGDSATEDPVIAVSMTAPAQSVLLPYPTADEPPLIEPPKVAPPSPPRTAPTTTRPKTPPPPPPATTRIIRPDAGPPTPADGGGATDASPPASDGGTSACSTGRYANSQHRSCCAECSMLSAFPCVKERILPGVGLTCEKLAQEIQMCQRRCDAKQP